jgi:hypothetical protein
MAVASYFEQVEKNEIELKHNAFREIKTVMKNESHKIIDFWFMTTKIEVKAVCHNEEIVVIAYLDFDNNSVHYQVVKREVDENNVLDELWGAGRNLQIIIENLF